MYLCKVTAKDTMATKLRNLGWSITPKSWNAKGMGKFWDLRKACVSYGCETWFLKLREERRLRVFERRVLRRIYGPNRDEVTGERRKLHNEKLNDLYCSPNIIRVVNREELGPSGRVV
jgi:hypothetical protein